MTSRVVFFLCLLSGIIFNVRIYGGETDSLNAIPKRGLIHHISFTAGMDYVASSVEDDIREPIPKDKRVNVHTAIPLNLRYSFAFTDPSIPNYYPGGYQGIALGVLNLGGADPDGFKKAERNIGYPVLAYLFQGGPFWKNNRGLSLIYEWNFGAAIGWKPYSQANKDFNLTVGSQVNAYLNLNLYLAYQLSENYKIFLGAAVSHFSNGNTSFPNPGINSFGVRVGMEYIINPLKIDYPDVTPDTLQKRRLKYDILVWGSTRKRVYRGGEEPILLPGHFACAGLSFSPMYSFNTWWRVGGSFDLQWDRSSDMKRNYIEGTTTEDIKFTTPNFFRQLTLGLSGHAELKMPIFAVNVGIGYNLVSPWENRGSYQNISLKTYVCEKIFLNVGYQLRNFHQQSSLMLGMGVSL